MQSAHNTLNLVVGIGCNGTFAFHAQQAFPLKIRAACLASMIRSTTSRKSWTYHHVAHVSACYVNVYITSLPEFFFLSRLDQNIILGAGHLQSSDQLQSQCYSAIIACCSQPLLPLLFSNSLLLLPFLPGNCESQVSTSMNLHRNSAKILAQL